MSTGATLHNPTGRFVAEHPSLVKLGRAGWAAKGAVYVLAGALAATVLFASLGWSAPSSEEASPTGAIKTVAATPGGGVLLWVLGAAMLLYAAWRVVAALMPGGRDAEASAKRIGYFVSAIIYTTFAITAFSLAKSSNEANVAANNGNAKVTNLTARILDHAGGRLLLGAIAVIVMGAAVYRIVKGVRRDVEDELDLTGMSARRIRWTRRLGAVGEVGRGAAIALIGFFLLRAVITVHADEATGLDGALRRLTAEWWGLLVVGIVALGFVAYGLFCLLTFTHRRFEAP